MTETWFNWALVNQREAVRYIANLAILFLIFAMLEIKLTPFGLFLYVVFNDYLYYKMSHKRYIDSNRKK